MVTIWSNTTPVNIGIPSSDRCYELERSEIKLFLSNHWQKDVTELIMMERAASALQGLYRTDADGPTILVQEYRNERHVTMDKYNKEEYEH